MANPTARVCTRHVFPGVFVAVILLGHAIARADEPDVVVADFEGADYAGWVATGDAFATAPARGTLPKQMEVTGFEGHGLVNSYLGGDAARGTLTSPSFTISRGYINFLIGGGSHYGTACMNLLVDGQIVRTATGSNNEMLAWFTWDVSALNGKSAKLQIVDEETGQWGHINVDQIVQSHRLPAPAPAQPLYQETWRPQFHFTARQWTVNKLNPRRREEGWLNDPNGLIYANGEYHFFSQRWNKCWIHAVSTDLVHWTELQPAFWDDSRFGTGVQSGTTVLDKDNVSKLSPDPKTPPLVAFWAGNDNKSQCVCYSLDWGRTWTRYAKNPVLEHPERDPKVFWHEPTHRWVMVLYGNQKYYLLTSTNLLKWEEQPSPLPDCFECPDMFPLAVDGDAKNTRWVLMHGDGNYAIGSFDGSSFKIETETVKCDNGSNFYATQTWENTQEVGGRRVQIAWMAEGKYPDMPFNQQITFPVELTLKTTADKKLRIVRTPVHEIESLYAGSHELKDVTLKPDGENPLAAVKGELFDIQAEIEPGTATEVTLRVRGTPISYHVKDAKLDALGSGPLRLVDGKIRLRLLVDRTSVETFGNDGELSLSGCFLPPADNHTLEISCVGGDAKIEFLVVHELKSAWDVKH